MNEKFESDLPSQKYWITELNVGAGTVSPYAVRFTLCNTPQNEEEMKKWLYATLGTGEFILRYSEHGYYYAEILFKKRSDATMFILKWGDSFV